ncbi:MAG: flippase-like domain-containing protein [Bacteroidetes bacterium]|nr:flippase-like domain-containing protein [Bacteroidota bacterium]
MESNKKIKKYAWVTLKLALSILGFWYAFQKIDVVQFKETLAQSNYWLVGISVFIYLLSQLVSSFRLQSILSVVDNQIPQQWNAWLYWQGMAYNLFLPGGIGGDAYKMLAYSKRSSKAAKTYVMPLLADRLFGLFAIVLLLSFLTGQIDFEMQIDHFSYLIITTGILLLPLVYYGLKKWFNAYTPVYWKALVYSLVIQSIQICAIICVLWSLRGETITVDFVLKTAFVFLVSSIATAIPVFMGGLGAREVVFATLFSAMNLSAEIGVWIALVFSVVVVISSAPGLLVGLLSKD